VESFLFNKNPIGIKDLGRLPAVLEDLFPVIIIRKFREILHVDDPLGLKVNASACVQAHLVGRSEERSNLSIGKNHGEARKV
jgi:hypothetical protein